MRRHSQEGRRSVDRGTYGRGIEPRNQTLRGADAVVRGGRPDGPGTTARAAAQPRAVGDPSHGRKLLAREPGEPSLARGGWCRGTRRQGPAPYSGDERGRAVGQTRSVRWAATCSGGLKSHWCSDGERHIQKRGQRLAGLDTRRGGQGVHREVESERLAEKLRAGIDGSHPDDEPVAQRGGKVESALWR